MADFTFNIAKGKVAFYASLPVTNDGLVVIPIEATGIESDATMKDYDTVAAILAASTNEQTTMGRKAATSVTATVDDTHDVVDVDMDDIVWTAASGNALSALLVAYDPDTTGGTDSDLVPLAKLDFSVTPSGGDITAQVAASDGGGGAGFIRAS